MDTSSANPLPVPQAPPAWHVAIATIAPLVVVVYATRSVMAIDERHGGERAVSSHETVVQLDCTFDCANFFALNSFADPHPLNLYGSSFYKKVGGRGLFPRHAFHALAPGTPISGSALWLPNRPLFHPLPTFRIRRRIPPARSLPPKNLALLY